MQRKRHINFKDKELNYSSSGRLSSMLHSIPTLLLHNRSSDKQMKNNLKSNVPYSIPCVKSCACTFCRVVNRANDDSSTSNPTHVVWWRSQNRISRSARAVILTRASQVVMTPLSRIRSWIDPYSRMSSWRKADTDNTEKYFVNTLCEGGAELTSEHAVRETRNDGIERHVPSKVVFRNTSTMILNGLFLLLSISFLSILGSMIVGSSSCYAADTTLGDSTASMTLDTSDVVVNVSAGQTGYASKSIVVSTNNTESYALTITAPATLKNSSTNSTNPWSYAYGQSGSIEDMSYTTFDGSTKQLEAGVESDGKAKVLAFSSTFAEGLSSGHYKAEVTLALTATPKATTTAKWLWSTDGSEVGVDSGITTMQQMTPEVCNQVDTPVAVATPGGTKAPTLKLKDSRDENEYTIAKLPDGRCWMVENLHISGGRTLKPSDSNVASNYTLPASLTDSNLNVDTGDVCFKNFYHGGSMSNTSCYIKAQSYITTPNDKAGTTGYYSWYAATAGTGDASVTTAGTNVNSSICPRGWVLPTGYITGKNTSNDFYNLFSKMDLGVTVGTSSNTPWGSSQGLAISQSFPYKFAYTGYVGNGSFNAPASNPYGYWWSRTANNSNSAYILNINSSNVNPGTANSYRYYGNAVRCIAEEPTPTTYRITYQLKSGDSLYGSSELPAAQEAVTTATEQAFTVQATPTIERAGVGSGCSLKNWLGSDGKTYLAGDSIVLMSSSPELTLTAGEVNSCRVWDV